jgi:hypothetical protein
MGEVGWERQIGTPTSKMPVLKFNQNPPYKVFLAAANLISTPLDRAALLAAGVLLADGVELHPARLVCSTS